MTYNINQGTWDTRGAIAQHKMGQHYPVGRPDSLHAYGYALAVTARELHASLILPSAEVPASPCAVDENGRKVVPLHVVL